MGVFTKAAPVDADLLPGGKRAGRFAGLTGQVQRLFPRQEKFIFAPGAGISAASRPFAGGNGIAPDFAHCVAEGDLIEIAAQNLL